MRGRTRRKLRVSLISALLSTLVSLVIGLLISLSADPPNFAYLLRTGLIGLTMGFFLPATDLFLFIPLLRRFRFAVVVGLKAIGLTAVSLGLFLGVLFVMRPLIPWSPRLPELMVASAVNLVICTVYSWVVALNRLLGRRVLGNFFTGRYFHPVEEQRIFMFLDLVSSTTIAEQIGHLQFHRLLHEFFRDITDAIVESGGEIYKYVGDEVIVVWRLVRGVEQARCVRCFFDICDAIAAQREQYTRRFGVVPEFMAGMHGGTVTAGELGDDRVEIAFLGDVVNTCARVQAECKATGERLLITQALLQHLELPAGMTARAVGQVRLRGKEQETTLHTVDR